MTKHDKLRENSQQMERLAEVYDFKCWSLPARLMIRQKAMSLYSESSMIMATANDTCIKLGYY